MLIIIPLIIILISLIIIAVIFIRKFPVLALLDVDAIPQEKEAKFKEQIMRKKFNRDLKSWGNKSFGFLKGASKKTNGLLKNVNDNLKKKKEEYQSQKKLSFTEKEKKTKKILEEVDDLIQKGENEKAEARAIFILTFDSHNPEAFSKLGEIYMLMKKYDEAKETYTFLLKLIKEREDKNEQANILFKIAEIYENLEEYKKAIDNVYQALEIHKNHPRYLDKLLDLFIKTKNLSRAREIFENLFLNNPENNKLKEWQEKIEELEIDKEEK
ncbi:tetratricopeptide repeat protein [bacterium]|nr:tetratricopeptide repeat protein [bacterium]